MIHFSPSHWDGPTSLYEMFDLEEEDNKKLLEFIPDYRINLLEPAAIEDGEFGKFNTTLNGILNIIKYSGPGQREKMKELLNSYDVCKDFGRDEVDVLNFCTNADLKINTNKEVKNVANTKTVWDELREEARNEVRDEVRNEVRDEVRNEVRDEVRNEVRDEVRNEMAAEEKKRADAATAELNALKAELTETKAKLAALQERN